MKGVVRAIYAAFLIYGSVLIMEKDMAGLKSLMGYAAAISFILLVSYFIYYITGKDKEKENKNPGS